MADEPAEPTTQGDRGAAAAQLRMTISRACRRLRQESESGLSPSLIAGLATLDAHGPLTPSQLAQHERLARPGVTRLIARLERDGLVTREPDARDGRSYRVAATPAGTALLKEARRRSRAYLFRALEQLDDEELAVIERATALLDRLLADES